MQDGNQPVDFRSAERTDRLPRPVVIEIFPAAGRIGTLQQMIRRPDDGTFPDAPVRALCRIGQAVDKRLSEEGGEIRTGDFFGGKGVEVHPGQPPVVIDAVFPLHVSVLMVVRMLDVQGLTAQLEVLLPLGIDVVAIESPAAQRMPVEQIHVNQNGQCMKVRRTGRHRLVLLVAQNFRRKEVRGAEHFGRVPPLDDEGVQVNDAGIAAARVDQDIPVGQIGMRKTRHVQTAQGLGDLQGHLQVTLEVTALRRIDLLEYLGGCEPFADLFLASQPPVDLKEEMTLEMRKKNAGLSVPADDLFRPAEHVLPIISADVEKESFAERVRDAPEAFHVFRGLSFFIESDDVVAPERFIDVLRSSGFRSAVEDEFVFRIIIRDGCFDRLVHEASPEKE